MMVPSQHFFDQQTEKAAALPAHAYSTGMYILQSKSPFYAGLQGPPTRGMAVWSSA